MLVLSIWLLSLLASTYLFQKVSGSLSPVKPNMISIIYYYSFVVSSYIGALLIALDIDRYYMINNLDHEEFRWIGFLILSFLMVVFPLIQLSVAGLFHFKAKEEWNDYLNRTVMVSKDFNKKWFTVFFFMLSAISLLAIAYTFLKTSTIPLLELLKGNTTNLAELRIEAARSFNGNIYIRNIFAIALTPILSLIAYLYASKTRELKWVLLFLMLLGASILINVYDLAKSPILFYLLMLILASVYAGNIKLNKHRIAWYGTVASVLIIIMYISIQGVTDLENYLTYSSGPIGRILLAQISPFFLHLDVYSHSIAFLDGKGLPSFIVNLFDMEQVRSARMVMENVFPENVDKGIAGVLNTIFIAEAFAMYGYLGILLSIVYVAIVVQIIYILFVRLPKTPVTIALFIFFTINIPRTLVGGFSDFLFNPIWIFLSIVSFGFLILEQYASQLLAALKSLANKRRTET